MQPVLLSHSATRPQTPGLKQPVLDADMALFEKLLAAGHMSPMEHQGQAISIDAQATGEWVSGNFHGFTQYRKMLPGENRTHPAVTSGVTSFGGRS